MAAKMDKEEDGSAFVRLQVAITDPVAIQKVLDKRYLTGSVGGRAGKAVCSISGDDLAAESADGRPKAQKFKRGQVYKGKLAFIDMQDISFKEYSFVNQPADSKSGVRKSSSGDVKVENSSDNWVARSSAFVLSMDEEDIYSVEEHKSILKGLKSKESKPLYLHLKGSFLTAVAVHESENYKYNSDSLLSNENDNKEDHEENSKMEESLQNEDVLAAVESLSQDLSTIATASAQETQEPVEEAAAASQDEKPEVEEKSNAELMASLVVALQHAKELNEESLVELLSSKIEDLSKSAEQASPEEEPAADAEEPASDADAQGSEVVPESVEEQAELKAVESVDADVAEENKVIEEPKAELTGAEQASEQDADDASKKLQLLEEENQKLKSALHRTLAERVVDTKIAAGIESTESREESIAEHVKRTASSLADSLRDLAGLPVAKKAKSTMPEISSEIEAVESEDNVITIDREDQESKEQVVNASEQVFVDALMGRRKL